MECNGLHYNKWNAPVEGSPGLPVSMNITEMCIREILSSYFMCVSETCCIFYGTRLMSAWFAMQMGVPFVFQHISPELGWNILAMNSPNHQNTHEGDNMWGIWRTQSRHLVSLRASLYFGFNFKNFGCLKLHLLWPFGGNSAGTANTISQLSSPHVRLAQLPAFVGMTFNIHNNNRALIFRRLCKLQLLYREQSFILEH